MHEPEVVLRGGAARVRGHFELAACEIETTLGVVGDGIGDTGLVEVGSNGRRSDQQAEQDDRSGQAVNRYGHRVTK